jgi:hypothetical protein
LLPSLHDVPAEGVNVTVLNGEADLQHRVDIQFLPNRG